MRYNQLLAGAVIVISLPSLAQLRMGPTRPPSP